VASVERVADSTTATGRHRREFVDSEIHKLVEAMAWQTGCDDSAEYDSRNEHLADVVTAAQDNHGWLRTPFGREGKAPTYSDFVWRHDLDCLSHLIQTAVARSRTSEDRRLLSVARRGSRFRGCDHAKSGRC
jgi:DUF1680 family protein